MLAVTGLLSAGMLLHYVSGFGMLDRAELGALAVAEADGFDTTTQTLAIAYAVMFWATAAAFLAWLSRSVDNVPALGGGRPDFSPRWAIG